jgi:hypothetical protein
LKIQVRLPHGSRPFLNPVLSGNNKLKPLHAVVDGKPEHHPEGSYFLRYAGQDGRRVWVPVGNDPQLALTEKQKREKSLGAQAVGVEVVDDAAAATTMNGTLITDAIAEYLAEVKEAKAQKTLLAYTLTRYPSGMPILVRTRQALLRCKVCRAQTPRLTRGIPVLPDIRAMVGVIFMKPLGEKPFGPFPLFGAARHLGKLG